MKKIFYGFFILSMVVGLFVLDSHDLLCKESSAESILNEEENLLTVNGVTTIKVKPDIAYVNVGVDTFDGNAEKAQTKNAEIMDKIVSELKKAGIKEEDIKTNTYNIYKTIKYEQAEGYKEKQIEGYNVRNIVEVTIRDIKKVGQIIDAVSKAGANTISNIRFDVTNENHYYNEALKIAMKNAKEKADAILSTFGAKAEKPYSIIENSYSSGIVYRETAMKYSADMAESFSTPIETGELEITARIMVKYKY